MPNFGHAPYEEAAAKGQARMSLLQRIGQIFAGAGQGVAASQNAQNPFEAGALGFAGAFGHASAARQAAEEYARKKIEAQQADEARQVDQAYKLALTERAKRPEPPPKEAPAVKPDIHSMTPEAWQTYLQRVAEEAKAKAAGRPAKPGASIKPFVVRAPRMREDVMKRIDLINQADVSNPEHLARLQSIIANPATPEEKAAADKKLQISPGYYRR